MSSGQQRSTDRSIRLHLVLTAALAALCGLAGVVGAETELSGAIVASGSLVVESNVKKVQHPTGGIVGDLAVADGQHVSAGDLLVRLDATTAKANLDAVSKNLWELSARQARLEAERDGLEEITVPDDLSREAALDPDIGRIVAGETRLFGLRRDALAGQKAQLRERVGQLREEISGLIEQTDAKGEEIGLIGKEYVGVKELWEKNLIQLNRVTSLERENARLKGERGQLVASAAQTKGKIAETELQVLQLDQSMRSDVAKELADIRARAVTFVDQKITALDQLKRIDIRAPQTGFVHELTVHTRGGVIGPGEQIMLIVPDADALVVEVRVAPQDIDQVRFGQVAMLRFPSFNQRTTAELSGHVVRVAPDVTEDKRGGTSFFLVRIALPQEAAELLGRVKLVPGMPVDAFIRTTERTVLSYLTKPLADQVMRAFREK